MNINLILSIKYKIKSNGPKNKINGPWIVFVYFKKVRYEIVYIYLYILGLHFQEIQHLSLYNKSLNLTKTLLLQVYVR